MDQEKFPQPSRRSTGNVAPVHILETKMIGKTYQTNNLIMKTVKANDRTIEYTTE